MWNRIRFSPKTLPKGEFKVLPALELIRLNHLPAEAVTATGKLEKGKYTLIMPSLKRELVIYFSPSFPYIIEGWEEQYTNKGEAFHSVAKRIHTDRRQYWRENNRESESLRIPFKLD